MTLVQEAGIELVFRWEAVHRDSALRACQEVVLLETKTIGTIGKGDIHHLCILLSLLHAVAHRMIGILGLNNSNGGSAIKEKHVVGILSLATCHKVTPQVYLTISKLHLSLHRDIRHRPALSRYRWRDISQFDILLTQQEIISRGCDVFHNHYLLVSSLSKMQRYKYYL